MAYITNAMIEERLGTAVYVQLTDDDGNGVANTGVVDEARLAAEGEVNSYLAARFAVPLNLAAYPDLSGVIVSITLDLAEYRLRARRPPISGTAVKRRAHAMEWLARAATGSIELPAAVPPSTIRAGGAAVAGNERVLSREEMSDF